MRWPRLPRLAPQALPPGVDVASGERVLAWSRTDDGAVIAATRDALYLPGRTPSRLPWEQVEAADWDSETDTLRISEVGTFGEQRPEHRAVLADPRRLLQLVRERVTASVVVWRSVPVDPRRSVKVIGRRPPGTAGGVISWVNEYDEGVDPDDPRVRLLAAEALASLRHEVGEA